MQRSKKIHWELLTGALCKWMTRWSSWSLFVIWPSLSNAYLSLLESRYDRHRLHIELRTFSVDNNYTKLDYMVSLLLNLESLYRPTPPRVVLMHTSNRFNNPSLLSNYFCLTPLTLESDQDVQVPILMSMSMEEKRRTMEEGEKEMVADDIDGILERRRSSTGS